MSADWEAVELTDEDDIAEVLTQRDYEEGVATVKGILIGTAISLAPWLLVAAAGVIVWVVITR